MPLTQPSEQRTSSGECRRCRTFCDRMVEPRGCLEVRCPYLYSYLDPLSGGRYMGCMQNVFRAEIDMSHFEAAECVNPSFFDAEQGAFDLRDALA
jgi:hypothetical protein